MPVHLDGVDEERLLMGLAVSPGREEAGIRSPGVLDLSLNLGQHTLQQGVGAALSG